MKFKNLFFPFVLVALVVTGCSSDDDNNTDEPSNEEIVGTWLVKDLSFNGSANTPEGEHVNFSGETTDLDDAYTLTFEDNNEFTSPIGDLPVELTVEKGDDEPDTQETKIENMFEDGSWAVDGDIVSITSEDSDKTTEYKIIDTEKGELELKKVPSIKVPFNGEMMDLGSLGPLLDEFKGTIKLEKLD